MSGRIGDGVGMYILTSTTVIIARIAVLCTHALEDLHAWDC